jgi:PadR family transcriptional regulator, regulatory protein PadR
MRKSDSLVALAVVLAQRPNDEHWGYDLSRTSGLRSGVLYPILQRLLNEGWVKDGWEAIDPKVEGRPRRRFYKLTEVGFVELGALAATAPRSATTAPMATPRFA